mmetsp:Transcript_47412/g.122502  ORF Transcript_47412/g.122502 Transcript_47412/m.122502 type:complete len:234 (+) Transcript_47412:718-1419(+)
MLEPTARLRPSTEKLTSPAEETKVPNKITASGASNRMLKGWPKRRIMATVTRGVVSATISQKEAFAYSRAVLFMATEVAWAAEMGRKRVVHSFFVGQRIDSCQTCPMARAPNAPKAKCVMVRKMGKRKPLTSCTSFTVNLMAERQRTYAKTCVIAVKPLPQKRKRMTPAVASDAPPKATIMPMPEWWTSRTLATAEVFWPAALTGASAIVFIIVTLDAAKDPFGLAASPTTFL